MKDFLARFKFLISFLGAIIIALTPHVYQSVIEWLSDTKIHFTYYVTPSYGSQILASNYPYKCATNTLIDKYIDYVRNEYREKNYTVDVVFNQDKVQIPIIMAKRMLEHIHEPSIKLITMPFLAKFNIVNESGDSITISHITITTDDAYSNPLWMIDASFSNNSMSALQTCSSSTNGYLISFSGEQMTLPAQNTFSLIIAFSKKPIIKNSGSFVTAIDINDKKKSVSLVDETKADNANVILKFVLIVFVGFFIVLGVGYLFFNFASFLSQQKK